jgi:methylation protein EvaC
MSNDNSFECWVCNNKIEPFMSFGQQPIANNFLGKENFNNEYFFEMETAFCNSCLSFQLKNQPSPNQMFNENYAFFSGTSRLMAEHFKDFSSMVLDYIKDDKDPFVVEIGSNDGIMLTNFLERDIRHLGIDPSENVVNVSKEKGINAIVDFFDYDVAKRTVAEYGKASAFIAANVMCHIPYINSVVDGIDELMKEEGVVIFEDPYLGEVIKKTTYDQIYDEHTFLFSAHSVQKIFARKDFELINAYPQETHGGSMRYILARKGMHAVHQNVSDLLKEEELEGLTSTSTYITFKENCESYKENLLSLLEELKASGKTIAGYAATSKSTTIINYCGITNLHLDCIYDTTPIKQNKFSPGAHIPIKPHSEFNSNYPDYALLFGYNHSKEIFAKEQEFEAQGGKWISFVPKVEIIE